MSSPPAQTVAEGDAPTDEWIARAKEAAEVARLEAEVDRLREDLATEAQNRKLRYPVAIAALAVMALQVAASNVIFGWYGDTNGWSISAMAIGSWMGTTVVEVVVVVLVIVNYLFPGEHPKYA